MNPHRPHPQFFHIPKRKERRETTLIKVQIDRIIKQVEIALMSWDSTSAMEGIDSSDDEAVSAFLLSKSRSASPPLPLHEKDNSSSSDESDQMISNGGHSEDRQGSTSPSVEALSQNKKLHRSKLVARKLTMIKIPSRKSYLALRNGDAQEKEEINGTLNSQPSLVYDLYKRQIDPMNGNILSPVSFINVGPFHDDTTNFNRKQPIHEQAGNIDDVVDILIAPCLLNSNSGWNISQDKKQFTLNTGKDILKVSRKRIFDLVTKKRDQYDCHDHFERDELISKRLEEDILTFMIDRSTAIKTSIESSLKRVSSDDDNDVVDDDDDDKTRPLVTRKRHINDFKSEKTKANNMKPKFILAKQSYPKYIRGTNTLLFDRTTLEVIAEKVFLESCGEKSTVIQANVLHMSMEDSSVQALTIVVNMKGRTDLVDKAKAKLNEHVIQIIACENIAKLTKGQLEVDIKLDVTMNLGADFVKGGNQMGIFVKDFKQNGQLERVFGRQMKSGIALMKMRRQSDGDYQNIFKLKDKNRIWNQAKEGYTKSKKETDKWVIANFRLERESDLSGLDIASVVLRNRKMQGIRLVDGSTLQNHRELNERIQKYYIESLVHNPNRLNTEPKPKTNSQISSREGHANPFEKFREKMQGVYEVEFKHLKFNANGIYSVMWEVHQRIIGKDCDSNCKCPSIVPQLTFDLVSKYCKNRKKSDPSWKPKQEVDLKKEVGFVRWFYPRFYQKVNDEFGGLNPLANLEMLLQMWMLHKKQLRYSDTCSFDCDCRSGWDYFKNEVRREQATSSKQSQKVIKPGKSASMILDKKLVFNPSKEDLGLYCYTHSNQVLIKSVNPALRKCMGLSVGSTITSFEVIAPNSTKKILTSHEELHNIYDNLKTQNNNTKLALWFKSTSQSGARNCSFDWDERGAWIGKDIDGWAGGAMTTAAKNHSSANHVALAIQSKKTSRIVPPSLRNQSRAERSNHEHGLVSQILETLDRPLNKGFSDIHRDKTSKEKRSPSSFYQAHTKTADFPKEIVDAGKLFRDEMEGCTNGIQSETEAHKEMIDDDLFPADEGHMDIARYSDDVQNRAGGFTNVLLDRNTSRISTKNACIESVDEDLFSGDDRHLVSTATSPSASIKRKSSIAVTEVEHIESVDEDLFPNDDSHVVSVAPSTNASTKHKSSIAVSDNANIEFVDEDLFPSDDNPAAFVVDSTCTPSNDSPSTAAFEDANVERVDADLFSTGDLLTDKSQHPKRVSILKRGESNPIKKRVAFGQNTTQIFWASTDTGVVENQTNILPSENDSNFSRGIKELSIPTIIKAFNADQTRDLTDFMKDVKRKRESIKNEMKKKNDGIRIRELHDLFKKYLVIDSLLKTYSKIQSTLKKASAVIRNADIYRIITDYDVYRDDFTERLNTIVHWFLMLKKDVGEMYEGNCILHANIVFNGINLLHVAIYVCNAPLITELTRFGLSVDTSTGVEQSPRMFAHELFSSAEKMGGNVERYKKIVEAINEL